MRVIFRLAVSSRVPPSWNGSKQLRYHIPPPAFFAEYDLTKNNRWRTDVRQENCRRSD